MDDIEGAVEVDALDALPEIVREVEEGVERADSCIAVARASEHHVPRNRLVALYLTSASIRPKASTAAFTIWTTVN